jgi:uncharacterized protein YjbI with pentapeptide repeats
LTVLHRHFDESFEAAALGGVRFSEANLAAVLPRLPETGAQPKRLIH